MPKTANMGVVIRRIKKDVNTLERAHKAGGGSNMAARTKTATRKSRRGGYRRNTAATNL